MDCGESGPQAQKRPLSRRDTAETPGWWLTPVSLTGNCLPQICGDHHCVHKCSGALSTQRRLGAPLESKEPLLRRCWPWPPWSWLPDPALRLPTALALSRACIPFSGKALRGAHAPLWAAVGIALRGKQGAPTPPGSAEWGWRVRRLPPRFIPVFSRGAFQRHPRGARCGTLAGLLQGPGVSRGPGGDFRAPQASLGSAHRGACSPQRGRLGWKIKVTRPPLAGRRKEHEREAVATSLCSQYWAPPLSGKVQCGHPVSKAQAASTPWKQTPLGPARETGTGSQGRPAPAVVEILGPSPVNGLEEGRWLAPMAIRGPSQSWTVSSRVLLWTQAAPAGKGG